MIVVDDGSWVKLADNIKPHPKLRLFRVIKDYGFNSHGCRNLIMKQSSNNWNILMDVDRKFDNPTVAFNIIKTSKLYQTNLYRFVAHSDVVGQGTHESVNDFLIHKEHFFSAGGYDEEIMGVRTGDREYFQQLLHFGKEKLLYGVDMVLLRRPSSNIGGNATSTLDKRLNEQQKELIQQRIKKPEPKKPILTFEWEEIT